MFRLGSGGQLCRLAFYRKHLLYFYRFSLCWCFSVWTYHHKDSRTRSSVIRALLFVYVCARSIPADRTGPGGLAGAFPGRNLFTNDVLHAAPVMSQHVGSAEAALRKRKKRRRGEKSRLHLIETFVCICECLGRNGMVVCVSASLHNPQVLACVTIPRCYVNALLTWLFLLLSSSFLFKTPLNWKSACLPTCAQESSLPRARLSSRW